MQRDAARVQRHKVSVQRGVAHGQWDVVRVQRGIARGQWGIVSLQRGVVSVQRGVARVQRDPERVQRGSRSVPCGSRRGRQGSGRVRYDPELGWSGSRPLRGSARRVPRGSGSPRCRSRSVRRHRERDRLQARPVLREAGHHLVGELADFNNLPLLQVNDRQVEGRERGVEGATGWEATPAHCRYSKSNGRIFNTTVVWFPAVVGGSPMRGSFAALGRNLGRPGDIRGVRV